MQRPESETEVTIGTIWRIAEKATCEDACGKKTREAMQLYADFRGMIASWQAKCELEVRDAPFGVL